MNHAQQVMAEQCTARGRGGVVCAAAPLAPLAGVQALHAGGNAYDAAVAAGLAEAVLLPPKCGLGGDLIAITTSAGADEPEALIAVGGAPAGLAGVARGGRWQDVGPNSVGPPAAAAGYGALAARGVLSRGQVAARAIDLARYGFPWAAVCTDLSQQAVSLVSEMNPDGTSYYPSGRPIAAGTLLRLPALADAIVEWVRLGAAFLEGPVGDAIVRTVRSRGGVLDHDSLSFARAIWTPCASNVIGKWRVWATPAPTHGPSLLDAVSRLASGDPTEVYGGVIAAIAARRESLSDPSGTSMVSAADCDGTVVVVVHSNSYPRFGSGLVVGDFDLVLNNRAGRGFSATAGSPNFPAAGRRPATTLHAWAIGDGRTRGPGLLGATPGGANQMPWNAQALSRVISGCDDPGVLVTAPLWEWLPDDDGVRIEDGFDDDVVESLRAVAPRTVVAPMWGCKSAQQVIRVPSPGEAWRGAADPRTQGAAIGM